ncbi:MAG TPA: glycosyltransferase [Terriglobales bacterium]
MPEGLSEQQAFAVQHQLLDELLENQQVTDPALWYYTPMAINFSRHLRASVTVYDCMDELSAFRGAPPGLRDAEAELFQRADLVFTGGQSLYESKKTQHHNVHAFPSSIDADHFKAARHILEEPVDQRHIPHPRLGFAGVLDERLDTQLIEQCAQLRPDWQFVMVGPVVKISDNDLPHAPNLHYLGGKDYKELPAYMAGWDIGLLPFARNESTRFISPTKTPEYLAAGLPAVSTSIRDVVRPYGELGIVKIADAPEEFIAACETLLPLKNDANRMRCVDALLAQNSWDITWHKMSALMSEVRRRNLPVESTLTGKLTAQAL